MQLIFYKYQGTGNDFILIDNRESKIKLSKEQVASLCHRRFGIGADGLMLLELQKGFDFKMVYYNSDGNESSMCGNGGRCITAFAEHLGIIKNKAHFNAIDGEHFSEIRDNLVNLKMKDVNTIEENGDHYFLNTGSPHYVKFVNEIESYDVFNEGRKIRMNERFRNTGTNVNFIEKAGKELFVRTYERGVEDETYSCGTGVTAAALVAALSGSASADDSCAITTLGGKLNVRFKKKSAQHFTDIYLEGPAAFVFEGKISL
ncbi:MAG: diaminopimelate epimerase [Bacteroidia bacterium]